MALVVGALLVVPFILAACSDSDSSSTTTSATQKPPPKVVATTVEIAALANEVAGDRTTVPSIIPVGADPHEFEPKASDLKAVNDADLILRHGLGLDAFLDKAIEGSAHAPIIVVTDGVDVKPPALEGTPAPGETPAEEFDPHVWHDPEADKVMLNNIRDALVSVDPDGAEKYKANATAYERVLTDTDSKIKSMIAEIPADSRKLVTNHDAFGYFARRYGLTIVGAVIPSATTASEPSAEDTANLLETIKREKVKAIFAESSVNPDLATQLANDAGVRIVDNLYGDTLGEPGSGAETVDGMLLYNARLIVEALK